MGVKFEMSGDAAKILREYAKVEARQDRMEAKLKQVGTAGKRAGDEGEQAGKKMHEAFNPARLGSFLTGVIGIGAALNGLTSTYLAHQRHWREIAKEARAAGNEIVAFASIQEGGTRRARVMAAAELAQRHGITSRGEAFNTVQALQSIRGGDFGAGMAAAEPVFAAKHVGIPVDLGRELEVQGAAQQQKPGDFIRMAFTAGEASGRDPATLAKAAPSLQFFPDDKALGFAVAGVLADTFGEDIATYVKAAGIGLSKTGGLGDFFKRHSVADSDDVTKLKALRDAGIVTPDQLHEAGLTEIRQKQALSQLIGRIPDVENISGRITRENVPGLLSGRRQDIEEEIPEMALQRRIGMFEAKMADSRALGPGALRALEQEVLERRRALAIQRAAPDLHSPFAGLSGVPIIGGLMGDDDILEDQRVTGFEMWRAQIASLLRGDFGARFRIGEETRKIEEELTAGDLREAAGELNAAARNLSQATTGGPAKIPATVDE